MGNTWRILKAAVEQEILFPSEKCYKDYLAKLNQKNEPYEIIGATINLNGSVVAVMRKRYNNNLFFGNPVAK